MGFFLGFSSLARTCLPTPERRVLAKRARVASNCSLVARSSVVGVRRFWREGRDQYETHEFVEQYDDVDGSYFGIGVIVVPCSSSL